MSVEYVCRRHGSYVAVALISGALFVVGMAQRDGVVIMLSVILFLLSLHGHGTYAQSQT